MKPFVRTLRVVNPHKRKRSRPRKSRARKSRRNPGELILLTNPYRGGGVTKMARKSRKRRSSRRRSKNPIVASHRRSSKRYSRRRHSNPASVGGMSLSSLAKIGVGTAVGAIATRTVTQALLGSKNTDYMGYGANLGVALGLGWAGSKFVSREVGVALATGGIAGLALRIYQEKIAMTSQNILSGMGDLDMGAFVDTGFALPSVSQASGGNYVVAAPGGSSGAGLAAGGSAAPQVVLTRFSSRYAN